MTGPTILLVGGGTGGHVYPMIAVADAIGDLMPRVRRVFVGSSRGIETRAVPKAGYELELMDPLPLRGGGVAGALHGTLRALTSFPEARRLLAKHRPLAVFSLGGYAAGVISLAARFSGIPLALMEPNSVIGLSNRLIAPWVERAYTAFDEAAGSFKQSALLRTGVAIRKGFDPVPYRPSAERLRVLVLGGSQGAQSLNEAVPEALTRVRFAIDVVHQAGPEKDGAVRELYARLGFESVSVVPFIDDMPAALAAADLVVGRAGAGAVSEICAVGRPSLLVPYPFAAGDHQRINAVALVNAGAAVCVLNAEATPERLAAEVTNLVSDRVKLTEMAARARAWGRPDAARAVAHDLLRLAGLVGEVTLGSGPQGVMRALGAEEVL